MGEVWVAAAVTVAGGVISGIAAKKKADADRKAAREDNSAMSQEESALSAQRTGYESALENFYNEKNRYEKQRGLDQYRQFSTMKEWAPNVDDQGGRIANPVMPKYSEFAEVEEEEVDPVTGNKKSLIDKRKDLHNAPKKMIKKLF